MDSYSLRAGDPLSEPHFHVLFPPRSHLLEKTSPPSILLFWLRLPSITITLAKIKTICSFPILFPCLNSMTFIFIPQHLPSLRSSPTTNSRKRSIRRVLYTLFSTLSNPSKCIFPLFPPVYSLDPLKTWMVLSSCLIAFQSLFLSFTRYILFPSFDP